jgi:hypothetical protein
VSGNDYTFLELLAFTAFNSIIVFPAFAIGLFAKGNKPAWISWFIIFLLGIAYLVFWAYSFATAPGQEYQGIPLLIGGVLIASNIGGLLLLWTKPLFEKMIHSPTKRFFAMWIGPVFLVVWASFQFNWV